jgi:hypothetical protein
MRQNLPGHADGASHRAGRYRGPRRRPRPSGRDVQSQAVARKTAIWPRVNAWSGQKSGGEIWHPLVIPDVFSASTNRKTAWLVGTSPKLATAGAGLTWRL